MEKSIKRKIEINKNEFKNSTNNSKLQSQNQQQIESQINQYFENTYSNKPKPTNSKLVENYWDNKIKDLKKGKN